MWLSLLVRDGKYLLDCCSLPVKGLTSFDLFSSKFGMRNIIILASDHWQIFPYICSPSGEQNQLQLFRKLVSTVTRLPMQERWVYLRVISSATLELSGKALSNYTNLFPFSFPHRIPTFINPLIPQDAYRNFKHSSQWSGLVALTFIFLKFTVCSQITLFKEKNCSW